MVTSVLACIFNKDTTHALCCACADGWRGAAFWGSATGGPVDAGSLGLTMGGPGGQTHIGLAVSLGSEQSER